MKKRLPIETLVLSIIFAFICFKPSLNAQDTCRIMFYNVENLFNPFHDSLKEDYEFVSGGKRGWTWKKYEKKLDNISKVIIASGGWQPPEIVAFSEVENKQVLIHLLKRTPLERFGYKIVHEESPDIRGIDVAMIYLPDRFKKISHHTYRVKSNDTALHTRDILYIKGCIVNQEPSNSINDTIHLFINHWPSRTGGPSVTACRRKDAALTLRPVIDSLFKANPNSNIVITGDFNDEPTDESISKYLNVKLEPGNNKADLYNLMMPYTRKHDTGTNKYRNLWGVIDQFIVSGSLLDANSHVHIKGDQARIIDFPFLLKDDEKFSGRMPFRTYNGMKYIGGFSDHLPVMITIELR